MIVSALKGLLMADEVPTPEEGVPSFLHALMWACIFGAVDAIIAGKHWPMWAGALGLSLTCHIVGINWPSIKPKISPRVAAMLERVAGSRRYRWIVVGFVIVMLAASLAYCYLYRNSNTEIATPIHQSTPPSAGASSDMADARQAGGHVVKVIDDNGAPLKGAEIYFIRRNGIHSIKAVSDNAGIARVMTLDEVVSVFCALDGFSSYYQKDYNPSTPLKIRLKKSPRGGSVIFADGTGSITGLSGWLNPILDTEARTYLYAVNIAIDGGKAQPVTFVLDSPMTLEDLDGHRVEIKIVSIIHSSS